MTYDEAVYYLRNASKPKNAREASSFASLLNLHINIVTSPFVPRGEVLNEGNTVVMNKIDFYTLMDRKP